VIIDHRVLLPCCAQHETASFVRGVTTATVLIYLVIGQIRTNPSPGAYPMPTLHSISMTYSWLRILKGKFHFRFMRAEERLMMSLAKTLGGYIIAICYTSLHFDQT
jgi:hypothetical protein